MIKQILVLFIFISSISFFKLIYIPKNVVLLLTFGSTILMVAVIIGSAIYDRGKRFKQHFRFEVWLMLGAVILSMFGALWGHGQPLLLTAWAQSGMYFYFFYFFLHAIRIRPEELLRLMLLMSILYFLFYFTQYAIYPRTIFGARMQEARGTIRIFVPGKDYVMFIYFYFLQSFFRTNNFKHLAFVLLTLVLTLLSATRSSILPLVLITIIALFFSRKVKSKFVISLLMIIGAMIVFFIFQDLIMGLIDLSKEQAGDEEENIRSRATRFFLTEFIPGDLYYFIGNGRDHMASPYGMKVWYYKANFGYYLSDLGIVESYVMYGVLHVIGVVLIIKRIFFAKLGHQFDYLKYYIAEMSFGALLGGVFGHQGAITVILTVLYMIDVEYFKQKERLLE